MFFLVHFRKLIFILVLVFGAAHNAMATPVHKHSTPVQHKKTTTNISTNKKVTHKTKQRTQQVAKKTSSTHRSAKKITKTSTSTKHKTVAKKTTHRAPTVAKGKSRSIATHTALAAPPQSPLATPPTLPTTTTQLTKQAVLPAPYAPVKTTSYAAPRPGLVASMSHRLVDFVHQTVSNLRYTAYKFGGTHFDTSRGVYIVDCSRYVDNILQNVYPEAYSNLVDYSGADTPTSQHYYNFFTDLSPDDQSGYWHKINDVEGLRAGDILVFRYKSSRGKPRGGHVMVVMDKPVFDSDDSFLVKVADSAPTRHSQDTRPRHNSGIGIGTLVLKTNPRTGHPSAFAWGTNSYWNGNVDIAMARPVDVG